VHPVIHLVPYATLLRPGRGAGWADGSLHARWGVVGAGRHQVGPAPMEAVAGGANDGPGRHRPARHTGTDAKADGSGAMDAVAGRSGEQTTELQSREKLV